MNERIFSVDGSGKDGAFCWWEPGRLLVTDLNAALAAVNRPNLAPKASTVPAALKETLSACISGAKIRRRGQPIVISPLSDEVKGCEAVMRHPGKEANVHDFVMSIVLDGACVKVAQVNYSHLPHVQGKIAALEGLLTRTFNDEMQWVPTSMVSTCIAKVIASLGGVLCRQTGGVYFIPEAAIPEFEDFADGIERGEVRVTVARFPLRAGERSYRLVADSLRKEISEALAEIEEGLNNIGKGEARANGQRSRIVRLMELRDKVTKYEEILGVPMADLQAAVEKVHEAVAAHTVVDALGL